MAFIKVTVSLILALAGSTVFGATISQERRDQATRATAVDPTAVYNVGCNGSYCQWRCNDNSDWCQIASVLDGGAGKTDPEWITCNAPQDCTKKIEGLSSSGRKAMCRSTLKGYRSPADLKCVANDLQNIFDDANARDEKWRKDKEARDDRVNMVKEKLPGGLDGVVAEVMKDMFPNVKKPMVGDKKKGRPKSSKFRGHPQDNFDLGSPQFEGLRYQSAYSRALNAVKRAALTVSDADLEQLSPEALKSRLIELAKKDLKEGKHYL